MNFCALRGGYTLMLTCAHAYLARHTSRSDIAGISSPSPSLKRCKELLMSKSCSAHTASDTCKRQVRPPLWSIYVISSS